MKIQKGDLVSFREGSRSVTGVVTREGSKVSLYIEDRPYRIIDATSYTVLAQGKTRFIYDYQIDRLINSRQEISDV